MTDAPHTSTSTSRRAVLRGAAVAAAGLGATVAVSSCATPESSGQTPQSPQTPKAPPLEVPKAKVPVGNGVVLEERFVVTQPTAGDFRAFSNICPHQGCTVSFVKEGSIVCPCHTSLFSVVDGSRTSGPARTGLQPAQVTDHGDSILIS